MQALDILSCDIDLEQSEHNKCERNNEKGYKTVASAADLPDGANDPSGAVAVSHQGRN